MKVRDLGSMAFPPSWLAGPPDPPPEHDSPEPGSRCPGCDCTLEGGPGGPCRTVECPYFQPSLFDEGGEGDW